MASIFDQLGGEAAVNAVVDKFYDTLLTDSRVNHYFKNTDMGKQRARQKQFLTLVTGGPSTYEGKDMKQAHCNHAITKENFDITWEHLEAALQFYDVPQHLVERVKEVFYSVEKDIVGQPKTSDKCPVLKSIDQKALNQTQESSQQEKKKVAEIENFGLRESNLTAKLRNDVYRKHCY
ncbi:unnamed protein product [Sphagnum balticum]